MAKSNPSASRGQRVPELLTLGQLAATKTRSDRPFILFMSDAEWRAAIKGLKVVKAQTPPSGGLLVIPKLTPWPPDGYYLLPKCPRGQVPIRIPGGGWVCRPVGNGGGGGGKPVPCGRSFAINPAGTLDCSGTCPAGIRCRRQIYRLPDGSFSIACGCLRGL